MKPTEPVSPGSAASGPSKNLAPLFDELRSANTAPFNHRKRCRDPDSRKTITPTRSCNPSPQATTRQEICRRAVEKSHARATSAKNPRAEMPCNSMCGSHDRAVAIANGCPIFS
jgi:hypothetical protein